MKVDLPSLSCIHQASLQLRGTNGTSCLRRTRLPLVGQRWTVEGGLPPSSHRLELRVNNCKLPQPAAPVAPHSGDNTLTPTAASALSIPALSVSTTYDTAVRILQIFFMPAINKTVERFVFCSRAQMCKETVQECITVL